jgi:hypothetical protein
MSNGYTVPDSYKTLTVYLIYTVKSDKSLVCDRGKKKIYVKSKGSIVIWDMDIS